MIQTEGQRRGEAMGVFAAMRTRPTRVEKGNVQLVILDFKVHYPAVFMYV